MRSQKHVKKARRPRCARNAAACKKKAYKKFLEAKRNWQVNTVFTGRRFVPKLPELSAPVVKKPKQRSPEEIAERQRLKEHKRMEKELAILKASTSDFSKTKKIKENVKKNGRKDGLAERLNKEKTRLTAKKETMDTVITMQENAAKKAAQKNVPKIEKVQKKSKENKKVADADANIVEQTHNRVKYAKEHKSQDTGGSNKTDAKSVAALKESEAEKDKTLNVNEVKEPIVLKKMEEALAAAESKREAKKEKNSKDLLQKCKHSKQELDELKLSVANVDVTQEDDAPLVKKYKLEKCQEREGAREWKACAEVKEELKQMEDGSTQAVENLKKKRNWKSERQSQKFFADSDSVSDMVAEEVDAEGDEYDGFTTVCNRRQGNRSQKLNSQNTEEHQTVDSSTEHLVDDRTLSATDTDNSSVANTASPPGTVYNSTSTDRTTLDSDILKSCSFTDTVSPGKRDESLIMFEEASERKPCGETKSDSFVDMKKSELKSSEALHIQTEPLLHSATKSEPYVSPTVVTRRIEPIRKQKERVYTLLPEDVKFCTGMIEKYGEDYEAMSKDSSNVSKDTAKNIQRKIRIFRDSPQYETYLTSKNNAEPPKA